MVFGKPIAGDCWSKWCLRALELVELGMDGSHERLEQQPGLFFGVSPLF